MPFENPMTFVRSIKGAPASVLFALLFTRHPMTNQELQRWTGYSDDTLTAAIQLLVDLGWIVALHARGPWAMDDRRQLPLMQASNPRLSDPAVSSSIPESQESELSPEEEKECASENDEPTEGGTFVESLDALLQAPNPRFSDSVPSSSIVENQISEPIPKEEEEKKQRAFESENSGFPEDEAFVKTLQALYDSGIREPAAGRLARLPHVSPGYVPAHVAQANAQGCRLGTAVYRIEHGWPLARDKPVLTVEDRIKNFLADRY
jgi:hypothetical protein